MKKVCRVCTSPGCFLDVYVDPKRSAGEVADSDSYTESVKVIIGLNAGWSFVADTLHHEISEFIAAEMGLRYRRTNQTGNGVISFMATHDEFDEWSMRTTIAFLMALSYVEKEWKKNSKNL